MNLPKLTELPIDLIGGNDECEVYHDPDNQVCTLVHLTDINVEIMWRLTDGRWVVIDVNTIEVNK
jgi:hypothetical protein